MRLWYNNIALHDLGRVVGISQGSTGEPEEAPQRWKKTLRIKLNFHEASYADNAALVADVVAALKTQSATLKWQDTATDTIFLEQTVNLTSHDLPEDPNAWGQYHQSLTLVFSYYDASLTTNCLPATFQRTGTGTPVLTLGRVTGVKSECSIQRYNPLRSARQLDAGRISLRGYFEGNPLASVVARRAALLAEYDTWLAEIKLAKDGRLIYGSFNEIVRIEEFSPELDQARDQINFTITASYTRFPNESGYAQAEFTINTRSDKDTGEVTVSFAGSIGANSKLAAIAKLDAIRLADIGAGYVSQSLEITEEKIADLVDAPTGIFIKINFSETLKKITGNILEWSLKISDAEEAKGGLLQTTYSGNVTAKGSTYANAYGFAADQARHLGDSKYQFKLNSRLESEDHQRLASGDIIVRVDFSYEYQRKGERLYMEVAATLSEEAFGAHEENISGYIIGKDTGAMDDAYNALLAGYNTRLIRNKKKTTNEQRIETKALGAAAGDLAADTTRQAPNHAHDATLQSTSGLNTVQVWRTEFGFTVHKRRASNATAMKYEFEVRQDLDALEKTTRIAGTVFAATGPSPENDDENVAATYLDDFLDGLDLGELRQFSRTASREKAPSLLNVQVDEFIAMNFDYTFSGPISVDGIIDCKVRETVKCSGDRIVMQPTAFGDDVPQICGKQSGVRTVSGTVTAVSEATAFMFIKKQRQLPVFAGTEGQVPDTRYFEPAEVESEWDFIPRTDGVARDGAYGAPFGTLTRNSKLVRKGFTFTERLVDYVLPI